ncbi:MAG: prolipoprotein diacylglyceryl transferase [Sphingobacteriales bacterium]|jgi:phosphatidylglycerol:prolipoprotein diacylglycerol transferase|nr:prolipoprotein diacylglyceryl transferase [Sphingobacteriales bacterium]MBP9141185.1 prolipoprotein diacylglyceryl transferase [Chitinophagales bacterium]MDA0198139.1 prolipoprotein diacylglyceryl transferase [Bacteroidota bacterium]MBK6889283.1 prolipoprotein diacylglyceryl transferase [Sphingobacteriales bacterium]MBK7528218.1 prolipoprotein diacylglyceryl transferase [Sphingobacteriales bacterium]
MVLTFIDWNASDTIFQIGSFSLRWYGLMWGMAILGGYFLAQWAYKIKNYPTENLSNLVQYIFWGGLIGARLGQIVFYDLSYYLQHPIEIFMVWKGGLASHGGALGVMAATWLYFKNHRDLSFWALFDVISLCMPLVGGLIRIGNLFNSELWGKPTDVPWAFIFRTIDNEPRHPVQIYEAIMLFGILAFLAHLWYHYSQKLKTGIIAGLFFTLTFGFRFLLEFFKANAETTQLLNLPLLAFGLVLLYLGYTGRLNSNVENKNNKQQQA